MKDTGIVDCHLHIIDHGRYPFRPGVGYTPRPDETGTREALAATLDAHGVAHALLVQPSGYGFDNSAMLDAMAAAPGRYKAIAVISGEDPTRSSQGLADRGVVGLRFNLVNFDPAALAGPGMARLAGAPQGPGLVCPGLRAGRAMAGGRPAASAKRRQDPGRSFRHRRSRRRASKHPASRPCSSSGAAAAPRSSSPPPSEPPPGPIASASSTGMPRRCSRPSARSAASGVRTGPSSASATTSAMAMPWLPSTAGFPMPPIAIWCCGAIPPACSGFAA